MQFVLLQDYLILHPLFHLGETRAPLSPPPPPPPAKKNDALAGYSLYTTRTMYFLSRLFNCNGPILIFSVLLSCNLLFCHHIQHQHSLFLYS